MEASALRSAPHGAARFSPLVRMAGDDRLVRLVREGSPRAFEAIYDRYSKPILSFCRHMLGSREEAEDAVQQSFLAAYNALVASQKPIQLRPWLYAIARNHCLSVLRRRRDQVPLEGVEPSVEGLSSAVQRREDLRLMLSDVSRLPDEQRAALVLSELDSLSHEEIADVLGCPREKVKALVFQARSSLAASRTARDTPCQEICEQLATLTGGALRRTALRRHLRECAGCRAFRDEVSAQRKAMALLLPVVPTAGLKSGVLSAVGAAHAAGGGAAAAGSGAAATAGAGAAAGGGAAGAGSGAGGIAAVLANAGAAKVIVGAALVAGAGVGGVEAARHLDGGSGAAKRHARPATSAPGRGGSPAGAVPGSSAAPAGTASSAGARRAAAARASAAARARKRGQRRGRSGAGPGRAGTSPGRAGRSPGRARTSPGRTGKRLGRSDASPGRSVGRSHSSRPDDTRSSKRQSRGTSGLEVDPRQGSHTKHRGASGAPVGHGLARRSTSAIAP